QIWVGFRSNSWSFIAAK
ncbi:DNA polymerase III, delta prime subunit domain protein, partial [Vibrio parahaemolyticus V-223/04]